MPSPHRRRRRLLLPTLLAAALAAELTGLAIASSLPSVAGSTGGVPQTSIAGSTSPSTAAGPFIQSFAGRASGTDLERDSAATDLHRVPSVANLRHPAPHLESTVRSSRPPTASTRPTAGHTSRPTPSVPSFRGRNHVWIPFLGVSHSVQSFPCSRSRPPDAGVYRWGCAGRNNVYLLAHAWSTFKPLHDAYVGGRLRKGMTVWYADGASRVHAYRVAWWRVVAPTTAASWAWASLARPSMTLQTCVGARSQYRLMVRLVQVS